MWHRCAFLAAAAAIALSLGCSKQDDEPIRNPAGSSPSVATPPPSGMSAAEMEKAHSEKSGATTQDLGKLKKAHDDAKAAFDKVPKDEKAKKAYVEATVKLGTATMMSPDLPPREKYRGALAFYREALKVDPSNAEANNNKKLIEGIYKQMGRPVPQ
jgi:hypothetical protein